MIWDGKNLARLRPNHVDVIVAGTAMFDKTQFPKCFDRITTGYDWKSIAHG
jgi:pentose-5-phosphate-3-epimerase